MASFPGFLTRCLIDGTGWILVTRQQNQWRKRKQLSSNRVKCYILAQAEMAELVDALDSKSSEVHPSCGFDSRSRHKSTRLSLTHLVNPAQISVTFQHLNVGLTFFVRGISQRIPNSSQLSQDEVHPSCGFCASVSAVFLAEGTSAFGGDSRSTHKSFTTSVKSKSK